MRMLLYLFSKTSSIYCCPLRAEDVLVNNAGRIPVFGEPALRRVGEVEEQTVNELMSERTLESRKCCVSNRTG